MAWLDLPLNTKQRIVGQLDVLSRLRLRVCSRRERDVVDSTDLFIPRINFSGDGEDHVKMVIYWKPERFVQLQFEKRSGSRDTAVVKRTLRLKATHERTFIVAGVRPVQLAAKIFKSVAMSPRTVLGGLQVHTSRLMFRSLSDINQCLSGATIRSRSVTYVNALGDSVFLARCQVDTIQSIQLMCGGYLHSLWPCDGVIDKGKDKGKDKKKKKSNHVDMGTGMAVMRSYERLSSAEKTIQQLISEPEGTVVTKVQESGEIRLKMSSCGVAREQCLRMRDGNRKQFRDTFGSSSSSSDACLLRWACAVHCDPFEHWYYTKGIHRDGDLQLKRLTEVLVPIPNGRRQFEDIHEGWIDTKFQLYDRRGVWAIAISAFPYFLLLNLLFLGAWILFFGGIERVFEWINAFS